MEFTGTGREYVGTPGFSDDAVNYVSFSVYSGTPYAAYSDNANSSEATVMKFNGTGWEYVGLS